MDKTLIDKWGDLEKLFDFSDRHLHDDVRTLALKTTGRNFPFDLTAALNQIECRQRYASKMPLFIANPSFLFPDRQSAEMASHQAVARFHTSLVKPGASVLDMTAGLGADAMAFSEAGCIVTACEMDPLRAAILSHNADVLGLHDFKAVCADSVKWLESQPQVFDTVFIDPARRGDTDKRVYDLRQCQPDILAILPVIMNHSRELIVKASPLLDISKTVEDFMFTTSIRVVCVKGECKEVLVSVATPDTIVDAILFESVNLDTNGSILSRFSYSGFWHGIFVSYAQNDDLVPGAYLYEPDAGIMKLACWGELCSRWRSLRKLDNSSHLFVSNQLIEDFPGRIFKIQSLPDKKALKALKGTGASVVTRNYPVGADKLRKQLGVKEDDNTFIHATRLDGKPVIIKSSRMRQE